MKSGQPHEDKGWMGQGRFHRDVWTWVEYGNDGKWEDYESLMPNQLDALDADYEQEM